MRKITITVILTLMLASCGIYNKYTRPDDVVTTGLTGNAPIVETEDSLPAWQDFFTDLPLQELIDSGLANNTNLHIAHLKVSESLASLKAAKLAYIPSLSFAPEGALGYTTVAPYNQLSKTFSIPVTANWQIDIFGSLTNAKRRAQAQVEMSDSYRQAVQTQLIATIATNYYTLQMLDAQLKLSEETVEIWEQSVSTMRALMEAGGTNEAACAQTEATYLSVCTAVEDLKKNISTIENDFCALLGETPHTIKRSHWNPDNVSFTHTLSNGIPLYLLANRPDVRQAEAELKAAFYTSNQARSAFYPSINIGGSAGFANTTGSVLLNPAGFVFSAFGALFEPIFQNGKLVANLRISKAQQEEAKLNFQQTLLNAGVEVNNAFIQLQTAQRKTKIYTQQVDALTRAVTSTQALMDFGSNTYLEVLTARQTLLSAQLNTLSNRFDEIQAGISLYQALGGGCATSKP